MMTVRMFVAAAALLAWAGAAFAADDPSIEDQMRHDIQAAMHEHVAANRLGDEYVIYDAVGDRLLRLTFEELHRGIVRKGDFYVSCADFVDDAGTLYDLDFLVAPVEGEYRVLQAVVHSVGGEKRRYHVED